jgi:hypothetical protein
MDQDPLVSYYLVMIFFQVIHILEEIGFEVYKLVGSLKKYLLVASFLVLLSFTPLLLIVHGVSWSYYLALLPTLIAIGNGLIHIFGLVKTRSFKGTLGAGVFSGVFLAISGVLVFIQLLSKV